MSVSMSRAQVLVRSAKAGVALVATGSIAGAVAGSAAADTIPDADLAYARLLVGAELLAADFYGQAIAAKHYDGATLKALKRALFNEQEHYQVVGQILSGAGQPPAVAEDFDFAYPKGAFASPESIAKLGVKLETAFLGAYLGAVDGLQTAALKQPAARIAASEAEHLSVFARLAGAGPVGISFPAALTISEASDTLDGFSS